MQQKENEKIEEVNEAVSQTAQDAEPATLKRQCEEYLAGWKRAQADYANLVRETERTKQEFAKFASEQTLLKLLPAMDQMEVAMRFAPLLDGLDADARRAFDAWVAGLEAIRSLWTASAKELGLERVTAAGPLDPSVHEAVSETAHESVPAGHVVRAAQDGWTLNGKLLRPAKVIVSQGPAHKDN